MKKIACFLGEKDLHYLDHLAPLADLLDIPLVTTDVDVEKLVEEFYPTVKTVWAPNIHAPILTTCDVVVTCMPKKMAKSALPFLGEDASSKKLVFCPHGQSDKNNLSALQEESSFLVYGKQMVDRLGFHPLKNAYFVTGNYRKLYYENKALFYQKWMQKNLPHLLERPFFFYAPTWEDYENSFSLAQGERFFTHFPKDLTLVVKLHPNTWKKRWVELLLWKERYKDQITFLENIPIVLPFVSTCQGYIGDSSSVGYDALAYNKPHFIVTEKENQPLYAIRNKLDMQRIKQQLQENSAPIKKAAQNEVFHPKVSIEELMQWLQARCFS